ncbi:MAG: hypothetical protein KDA84_22395, partial [Planctomycetaceae bacterium]|nr:hypothetical protein [Planctomycetaceae bacterium]
LVDRYRERVIGARDFPDKNPPQICLRQFTAPLCCEMQQHLPNRYPSWESLDEAITGGNPVAVVFTPVHTSQAGTTYETSHQLLIVGSLTLSESSDGKKWLILIDPRDLSKKNPWLIAPPNRRRILEPNEVLETVPELANGDSLQEEHDFLRALQGEARSTPYLLMDWSDREASSVYPLPLLSYQWVDRQQEEYRQLKWTLTYWFNLPGHWQRKSNASKMQTAESKSKSTTPGHSEGVEQPSEQQIQN